MKIGGNATGLVPGEQSGLKAPVYRNEQVAYCVTQ